MEVQLDRMNAVLQNMQQALKCSICLDMLNKPLTTKCGHSFCGECVQQLVRRPRGSAQCPLCLRAITRRSLSQNAKVAALVLAVRKVIASIKKDCCFEVTPSKYRPRPRPAAALEDDDSENEEKDEPRRGTRKRGATALYNPEVVPPRPRPAKRRILAANGAQELSLHTETSTAAPGDVNLLDTIARDHSYSSPTKQAPLERTAVIPQGSRRSRGRGGQSTYLGPRKIDEKNGDHLVSASQGDLVLPGEVLGVSEIRKDQEGQVTSLPKLGHQCAEDKVAKWLDKNMEVGFQIGVTHSSDAVLSSGYAGTARSTPASEKPSTSAPSTSTLSTGIPPTSIATGIPSNAKSTWKFFKSKGQKSTTATTAADSQDTYNFVPSQPTPKQGQKQRGRGRTRGTVGTAGLGRVRGRGRGSRPPNAMGGLQYQSTPMSRLKAPPQLEVSAIHPPGESVIVYAHDDDDLPDSCPVNTLDNFDQLVAETKENNPPLVDPECPNDSTAMPPASQEDKDAGLLFVTPAQDGEQQDDEERHPSLVKDAKPKDTRGRQSVCEETLAQELLAGVEDHELTLVTPREEEEGKQRQQQQREAVLREDLSLLNLTHDNTQHNKTLPVPTMAPPAAPVGRKRRVRFTPNATTDSELQKPKRANIRYTLKQRLVDSGRPGPAAVGVKSARNAKSPGWSHIVGARKDLVPRNTSLNITGGEELAETREKRGHVASSVESLTIEDTQFDVEHLTLSQTKKERVQRLKNIVSLMSASQQNQECVDGHSTSDNDHSSRETTQKTTGNIADTTANASVVIGNKKRLKLSVQKLVPAVEKKAQTAPYIVKDTEMEAVTLSPPLAYTATIKPVLQRKRETETVDRESERDNEDIEGNKEKCVENHGKTKKGNLMGKEAENRKIIEDPNERERQTVDSDRENEDTDRSKEKRLEIHGKTAKKGNLTRKEAEKGKFFEESDVRERKTTDQSERENEDALERNEQKRAGINEKTGKKGNLTRKEEKLKNFDPNTERELEDVIEGKTEKKVRNEKENKERKNKETERENRSNTAVKTNTEPFSPPHSNATVEKDPDAGPSQQNTAKRKEMETQELEQHTALGKRVKQRDATTHSTEIDTARPQRKTFSFSTDTEDLNSLIHSITAEPAAPLPATPHRKSGGLRVASPAAHSITAASGKGAVGSLLWSSASCDPAVAPTQQMGRAVVPFRAVGRLCSERCAEAGAASGAVGGGALRDLCLHAVPCEVYQVLMKYIGLLETQGDQHSVCCGKGVQQQPDHQQHHQQPDHQPPPPPPPATPTTEPPPPPPATTPATPAPAAALEPESVCGAAACSPVPVVVQGVAGSEGAGARPCVERESEPLFESEVVAGSCLSEDLVTALPLGVTPGGAGAESQARGASQAGEQLSEVFGLPPEALGHTLVQPAASQASQESVSMLAECGATLGLDQAEQDSQVPERAERRASGAGRARERAGAGHRMDTTAQTEVEKENVGGRALGRAPSLCRKPCQASRPVLEDILTQRGGQGELAPSQKASLPPTAKPALSKAAGRGRGQRNEESQESDGSGAEDGAGRPTTARLSGRKRFRRIARPPSSSSDSDDAALDPPAPSHPPPPPPPPPLPPTQHLLDSEEMRDLERLDQNVWAEFGRPDDLAPEDPRPASPTTTTTTTTTGSLSASTRRTVDRAARCLDQVEGFLGSASLSQHPSSPPLSPDVVQATDDEEEEEEEEKGRKTTEEEEETQSHGSSQSEPISTQFHNQMKAEIEALRKRKEEVMAAMVKKNEKGEQEVAASQAESLGSTWPFVGDMEGDQDLFHSNPNDDDLPSLTPRQPSPPPPPPPPPKRERIPRAALKRSTQRSQRKRCALFSGLGVADRKRILENLQPLEKMGLAVRPTWGTEITHVVVHTKNKVAPRTLKYLQGVATGCWVVNHMWVLDSLQRGKLQPEEPYGVVDETGEDGPTRSRTSHEHLLERCEVYVVPPFEDMTLEQVEELVEMAGARVVASPKGFSDDPNTFSVLLLDSEREQAGREAMSAYGRVAVGHNWLVDSITAHRLAPLADHLLAVPTADVLKASHITPALMGSLTRL